MSRTAISAEALVDLRRQLGALPLRSAERRRLIHEASTFYGVSEPTLYRLLRQPRHPWTIGWSDRGAPRVVPKTELERYLELIAALKVRTANRKARHLSTAEAIRLLEDYGLDTPEGRVQAPKGVLKTPTVHSYLKAWGLNWRTLRREPPAVRFQAQQSNALWQFDISPSDLKHLKAPAWIDESKGQPTLMLFSVVDDRSGVAYQEYHCAYGEAVEVALQFLFNAMSPKSDERFPFGGRLAYLYADNGPVTQSHVFRQVMEYLGIEVQTHLPRGHDGRRTTARSKGKVERPFRTVREAHETLYHFHGHRGSRSPRAIGRAADHAASDSTLSGSHSGTSHRFGEKPVTPTIVNATLAPDMHELEPTLTRYGYNVKALSALLHIRQAEVRSFLYGQLPPGRTEDLHRQLLAAGIPLGDRLSSGSGELAAG